MAVDKNGGIGLNNELPWNLPGDLQYFKEVTLGKPIIMGRKTMESLPGQRPLPGRQNFVISSVYDFDAFEGFTIISNPFLLMFEALEAARLAGVDEVFVIGGAGAFNALNEGIERFYITRIHEEYEVDTYLPSYFNFEENWRMVKHQIEKDPDTGVRYDFEVWERRKQQGQ